MSRRLVHHSSKSGGGSWSKGVSEVRATTRAKRSQARTGFNRDEGDERDDGNSTILRRHSGHGRAVIRNPASPVIARSVEVDGGAVAIPGKERFL